MRLCHTIWAAAAFAAAGVGFYAGTNRQARPDVDVVVAIPACEEIEGPSLVPAESIDLSCVEPVLPYDLFAHTSEPPLAAANYKADAIVQVGFEFPEFEGPVLQAVIPACKDDPTPGTLPKCLEKECTELPCPDQRVAGPVSQSENAGAARPDWRYFWMNYHPSHLLPVRFEIEIAPRGEKPPCTEFQSGGCPMSGECPCCEKAVPSSKKPGASEGRPGQ